MKKGISACIIGKNEEKNLNRCLSSVEGVVDEIIYFDTGSTDNTIDIARKYKAKVYEGIFENDFSKVRNKCKSYATYEWILILDCDEELNPSSREGLKQVIEIRDAEAFVLSIVNIINGKINDKFQYSRLFRNRQEYEFEGKIHEQVAYSIIRARGEEALQICDIEILHHGYGVDIQADREKTKRNLKILNTIPEKDRDGFYFFNLGNEYGKINDLQQAIYYYEKSVEINNKYGYYIILLYERLAHCYYNTGKVQRALNICKEGLKLYEEHIYFYYIEGLSYLQQMKFTTALNCLSKADELLKAYLNKENHSPVGLEITNKEQLFQIIEELKEATFEKYKNMLTAVIDCRRCNKAPIEGIYSVNEISDEVIIVHDKGDFQNDFEVAQYKTVEESRNLNLQHLMKEVSKHINTDYVLYLNYDEGLTFESELKLSSILSEKKEKFLYLKNMKNGDNEVRIMKKNYAEMVKKADNQAECKGMINYFL